MILLVLKIVCISCLVVYALTGASYAIGAVFIHLLGRIFAARPRTWWER